ncbi:MAG: hypothetical protein ACFUZC_07610 [Chthoniobacteraceae bacterium]
MSAKATAIFEADDKQFSNALLNINRKLLQFQHTIAKLAIGFEVLKKGAELVSAGVEHFTAALDKGGELLDLSNNTGIAVRDLAILQQQFKLSGKAAEDVGPVMAKMMKGIESGSAAGIVKRLGLDMDELRKKTPSGQFQLIGEAINKLPDPAERATAAMEVFGKSGASLLAVFADNGFGQAAEQVGNQAELLNKDAALFDDISDKLATAGLKVQGFFVGVADRVAPVIKPLLDKFATLDLSSLGQEVGESIALFIQAFQDGKLGEVLLTSMELSFAEAANFLLGLLTAIGNVIAQMLLEGPKNALAILQIATTADFWKALGAALLSIAARFTAALLSGIADLIDNLKGIPLIGDKIHGGAQAVRSKANEMWQGANAIDVYGSEKLAPAIDIIKARMGEELQNIAAAAGKGFNDGNSVIDTSGISKRLDKVVTEVLDHVQESQDEALKELPTKAPDAPIGEQLDNKPAFSHLQKIGGGGYTSAGDPLLTETRQQTKELRELNKGVKTLIEKQPRQSAGLNPVFT